MPHVLAFCDTRQSVSQAIVLVQSKTEIIYRTSQTEIDSILTLESLNQFNLIVITALDWQIRGSSFSLIRKVRKRFNGAIVAINDNVQWRQYMEETECCTHVCLDDFGAAELIRDLLFPPEPLT